MVRERHGCGWSWLGIENWEGRGREGTEREGENIHLGPVGPVGHAKAMGSVPEPTWSHEG